MDRTQSHNLPAPAICIAGLFTLLAAVGCVPLQFGANQVPDVNVNITELKDAGISNMPADVDAVMAEFLAATGPFDGKSPVPGCAIGIMEDNAVTHVKGYGFADVGVSRPFTPSTPSVVGSVSKTWTALAALRLMELGLLDLEDTVGDYLPSAPAAWQGMTIRELLSHTTGLAYMPTFHPALDTETELGTYWFGIPLTKIGILPKLVWPSYTQTPVTPFDAGKSARYSNTGYMLAGTIIELIAGANPGVVGSDYTTYEAVVWRQVGLFDGNISNSDQMTSQALNEYWRQTDIPNLAKGYVNDAGAPSGFSEVNFFNSALLSMGPAGWEGPAGAWTMTIGDLARLMAAIQNNDIISQPTRDNEMMQTYGSDNNGNWGLGVNRTQKLNLPVYLHDGSYPGYRARYTVWPGEDFGVAIMCNGDNADIKLVVDDIAEIFFSLGAGARAPALAGPEASLQLALLPEVDGDDPKYERTFGSRGEPLPMLSDRELREAERDFRQEEQRQRRTAMRQEQIAENFDHLSCPALLASLLTEHDPTVAEALLQCFEEPRAIQSCLARESKILEKLGLLDKRTHGRLVSCGAVLNLTDF